MNNIIRHYYQRLIRCWGFRLIALANHPKSWLKLSGWSRSFGCGRPVDRNGDPIPWFTYACISFLEEMSLKDLNIFEYGCGNSSIWFAKRANLYFAVEGSSKWANEVQKILPPNGKVFSFENKVKYLDAPKPHAPFDIVVVDGEYRNECCRIAAEVVNADGVIILDDSERSEYNEGIEYLRRMGFKKISFGGPKPSALPPAQTSIFYRTKNVLNI